MDEECSNDISWDNEAVLRCRVHNYDVTSIVTVRLGVWLVW